MSARCKPRRNVTQRLRAGLTSVAPPVLRKEKRKPDGTETAPSSEGGRYKGKRTPSPSKLHPTSYRDTVWHVRFHIPCAAINRKPLAHRFRWWAAGHDRR